MISVSIREKFYSDPDKPVLEDLNFSVARGEVVAIIGPSGAGKSTLLNLICGLDKTFNGDISLNRADGKPTRFGFMFQEPRLMPWLTALNNVCLVADDKTTGRQRAKELLSAVGLADVMDRYPKQLSGGMQRRVALARAFLPEPDILLMDEPFVSIDHPSAAKLRQLLIELWENTQPTILYVTHSLSEAIVVADRLLFLSKDPARLVLEETINIPKPRQLEDNDVKQAKRDLLRQHPDLLTGKLALSSTIREDLVALLKSGHSQR